MQFCMKGFFSLQPRSDKNVIMKKEIKMQEELNRIRENCLEDLKTVSEDVYKRQG